MEAGAAMTQVLPQCLTADDIRIFSLLAEGFTHAEIAVEMNFSKWHIDRRVIHVSQQELGVRNERAAIAVLARAMRI
jgi:DNA-binding NarL/FixJ family response regulator